MIKKFQVVFPNEAGPAPAFIYADSEERAMDILRANFGPKPKATLRCLREATPAEIEAVKNTGSRSPRRRNV